MYKNQFRNLRQRYIMLLLQSPVLWRLDVSKTRRTAGRCRNWSRTTEEKSIGKTRAKQSPSVPRKLQPEVCCSVYQALRYWIHGAKKKVQKIGNARRKDWSEGRRARTCPSLSRAILLSRPVSESLGRRWQGGRKMDITKEIHSCMPSEEPTIPIASSQYKQTICLQLIIILWMAIFPS